MNTRLAKLQNELGITSAQAVPEPKNIIKSVNKKINDNPQERKIYMKRKIFSAVLVAAIIMSLAGLTVFAAATFNWHEKLIEYFNPTEQQMESLAGNVDAPQATATDNGVTVNVLQTLADKHGIYVLYEVLLPENITITQDLIDKELSWRSDMLSIDEEEGNEQLAILSGSANKILSFEHNRMTILKNQTTNSKYNKNQKVTLNLGDMSYYIHTDDEILEEVIAPCNIELSWSFDYVDNSIKYDINMPVNIVQDKNSTLKSIEVSPMSVWVTIEGDDVTRAVKPIIKFNNQSSVQIEAKNDFHTTSNYMYNAENDKGVMTIGYCFDTITNISDIDCIIVGDITIPIN